MKLRHLVAAIPLASGGAFAADATPANAPAKSTPCNPANGSNCAATAPADDASLVFLRDSSETYALLLGALGVMLLLVKRRVGER